MHYLLAILLLSSTVYGGRYGYGNQQAQPVPTLFGQWPSQVTKAWPADVQNELKPFRDADLLVANQVVQQFDRFSSLEQLAQTLQAVSPPLANFLSQEIIGVKNALSQFKMKSSLETQLYVNELSQVLSDFLAQSNNEFKSLDPTTKNELKGVYPTISKLMGSPISQKYLFNEASSPLASPTILPTPYAANQNLELQKKLTPQNPVVQNPYGMNNGRGYNRGYG